jgi:hypothetical protein
MRSVVARVVHASSGCHRFTTPPKPGIGRSLIFSSINAASANFYYIIMFYLKSHFISPPPLSTMRLATCAR